MPEPADHSHPHETLTTPWLRKSLKTDPSALLICDLGFRVLGFRVLGFLGVEGLGFQGFRVWVYVLASFRAVHLS